MVIYDKDTGEVLISDKQGREIAARTAFYTFIPGSCTIGVLIGIYMLYDKMFFSGTTLILFSIGFFLWRYRNMKKFIEKED